MKVQQLIMTAILVYGTVMSYGQSVCVGAQNTPPESTVQVWDWREPTFQVNIKNNDGQNWETVIANPFIPANLSSNPNIEHLYLPAYKDFHPEDGWELVIKNFGEWGSPASAVRVPTYALYNRYSGLMRVFAYLTSGSDQTFNGALLNVYQPTNSVWDKRSANLEHINHPANALEAFDKNLQVVAPNSYSQAGGTWILNEFTVAYDPCVCLHSSSFRIRPTVFNISYLNFILGGTSNSTAIFDNGQYQGNQHPFSVVLGDVPGAIGDLSGSVDKGQKVFKNLTGDFASFIASAFTDLPAPQPLPSWIKNTIGIGGAIFGLNTLIGGGGGQKTITGFNSTYSFDGSGTLVDSATYMSTDFYTPGSLYTGLEPQLIPTYNNPMGVMTLLRTPVIQKAEFELIEPCAGGNGDPNCVDETYQYSYKFDKSSFRYAVNTAAGLGIDPSTLRVSMTLHECSGKVGAPDFSTPFMPVECLDDFSVAFESFFYGMGSPVSEGDAFWDCKSATIKVMATLHRLDNGEESTFFLATYKADLNEAPYSFLNTPPNPYQNIPENITVSYLDYIQNPGLYEAWNSLIVTNVPAHIIIDPTHPQGYTIHPGFMWVDTYGWVWMDGGSDINGGVPPAAGDQTVAPKPPCAFTPPATLSQINSFCQSNRYNPVVSSFTDGDELFFKTLETQAEPSQERSAQVHIYPQPAANRLYVQVSGEVSASGIRMKLMDSFGRVHIERTLFFVQEELDISSLPSGVYVFHLDYGDGMPVQVEKVIKL